MSKIDDETRLRHMFDAVQEAMALVAGKTRDDLDNERTLALALVKLIEIVGEAAANISRETQEKIPQIPWPQIIGMRNRLIHAYFDIDLEVVWKTITEDLPPLANELQQVLGAE
jgi:uncharacterized protein with HEPN domain